MRSIRYQTAWLCESIIDGSCIATRSAATCMRATTGRNDRRQDRVGEHGLEDPRQQLDDLAIASLLHARDERRTVMAEPGSGAERLVMHAVRGSDGQVPQQFVETQQNLFELGPCASTLRDPRAGTARSGSAALSAAGLYRAEARLARRAAGHAREQPAERARSRHVDGGWAGAAGAAREDDGPVDPGLDALRLEARRGRRPRILQQSRGHAGRKSQQRRALDLRGGDGAGGLPQRGRVCLRTQRIRIGADVRLPDQCRREGLQLAQLPFGGRVDELDRPRDLDVDIGEGLVDELQSAEAALGVRRPLGRTALRAFGHDRTQGLDERRLVQVALLLQGGDQLEVVIAFGGGEAVLALAQELQGAGQDARDQRG